VPTGEDGDPIPFYDGAHTSNGAWSHLLGADRSDRTPPSPQPDASALSPIIDEVDTCGSGVEQEHVSEPHA
jgi:hypothetical protein